MKVRLAGTFAVILLTQFITAPFAAANDTSVISGTVTDETGAPIEGICVDAVRGRGEVLEFVGTVLSGEDGTYELTPVAPGEIRVRFEDCNFVGPYIEEWFDDVGTFEAATVLTVPSGGAVQGVDAVLAPAGLVTGTVADRAGDPVEGICVQVVGDARLGGSAVTDASGGYRIALADAGDYRVQFVDCRDEPTLAGRWFGVGSTPESAQRVRVVPGATAPGVSVALDEGAPSAVTGTVRNVRGEAMTTACAVLYLADEWVEFERVGTDGTFRFDGVGSGTYAVAVVGCPAGDGDGDAQVVIPDPATEGVGYDARWLGGATLALSEQSPPDPIAQGADLLTVDPGGTAPVEICFGCNDIALELTATEDSVVAAFELRGVRTGQELGDVAAAASDLEFELSCSTDAPGAAGTVSVAGTSSPLVAGGLDPGAVYGCAVSATMDGLLVARSTAVEVLTAGSAADPAGTLAPSPQPPATAATPRPVSFAG